MKSYLLYSAEPGNAMKEITGNNGQVVQQFSQSLFVASLPNEVNAGSLKYSTLNIPDEIEERERLSVEAWKQYNKKLSKKALAPDATKGLSWDTEGFQAPREMKKNMRSASLTSIELAPGKPTSEYMIGSIAVGVIIVSGPEKFQFNETEIQQIVAEVQEGLQFLATLEPRARITFIHDIHVMNVTAAQGSTADFESAEAPWRDEALGKMGFESSRQGSMDYVQQLREQNNTDWAYVGYFTKYDLHHFAYAEDEKVVMNYFNDGWKPKNINAVFAHETCHIFGAADEYAESNCNCNTRHGHLKEPNGNCANCAPAFAKCLMERNQLVMCKFTRRQIGWDEQLFPQP